MGEVPYATVKRTTYENFVAACPVCERENIYNRASDLKTFELVPFREVKCNYCRKPFNINGDSINAAHEMLLFECRNSLSERRYMQTVLTVAQAYEVFAALYARAELLYKPYANDGSHDLDRLNALSKTLVQKIGKWSFDRMRALVLWHLLHFDKSHDDLAEAEIVINSLPDSPREPKTVELARFKDDRLRRLALGLKMTTVHTLRNKVVHMRAYRPTREEAEGALDEAGDILHLASFLLGIYDDLNCYPLQPGRTVSREKG